uniref:receptor protein serine/threonine kinase n=1 Tax=Plectus sambesii TaxID=2011161 RepID=A0A914WDN6_9BILA
RYLSPEVLSETMPLTFDAFRMSDIYSMGLIMWEIVRRTNVKNQCETYELPYYDMVPSNPSQEDMRVVVVDRNCRPALPSRFDDFQFSPVLAEVTRAMRECWSVNPHARNQALVVRNMIDRLCSDQHLIL